MRRATWVAGALLSASVLWGCSFSPAVRPVESVDRLPEAYPTVQGESEPADASPTGAEDAGEVADPDRSWEDFGDPALSELVDSVLARNRDLRRAALRVVELQSLYRIQRAGRLPAAQFSIDGTRQSTPTNSGATGRISDRIPGFPDRFDFTTYSASLGLSFELDLWGRVREASQAALNDWAATRADLEGVRLGLIAEAVSTYLEVADVERQLRAARETADLLGERATITADRYARGLVGSFELYRIRQALEESRAAVPVLEIQAFDARSRLAVLAGGFPGDLDGLMADPPAVDVPPGPVPAGLPSDLLARRPDVVAAEHRMEAARRRVGVARADRFPRLSLTASGGTQSSELADLTRGDQRFGLLSGAVLQPLFNSGALNAAARAAVARYEQATAAYDQSILTAFREVSAALVAVSRQSERLDGLTASLEEARASEATQFDRYRRGVGDYVALLDARINRLRAESAQGGGLRAAALARLTLHRALGGAWVEKPGS